MTTAMKPYRVLLKATVEVAIEVYARSEDAARAKAFNWTGGEREGWSHVGEYDTEEQGYCDDDDEMYWAMEDVTPDNILDVIELVEDDAEAMESQGDVASTCEMRTARESCLRKEDHHDHTTHNAN